MEKVSGSQIVDIDKRKYLVPSDITVAQFMWIIRKRIQLPSEKAIFLFVDKTVPQSRWGRKGRFFVKTRFCRSTLYVSVHCKRFRDLDWPSLSEEDGVGGVWNPSSCESGVEPHLTSLLTINHPFFCLLAFTTTTVHAMQAMSHGNTLRTTEKFVVRAELGTSPWLVVHNMPAPTVPAHYPHIYWKHFLSKELQPCFNIVPYF